MKRGLVLLRRVTRGLWQALLRSSRIENRPCLGASLLFPSVLRTPYDEIGGVLYARLPQLQCCKEEIFDEPATDFEMLSVARIATTTNRKIACSLGILRGLMIDQTISR